MRMVISVDGRFHAFNLAQQLHQRGVLERLIASYPRFATVKYGIPAERITSLPLEEFVGRAHGRLPAPPRCRGLDLYINDLFERQAARFLPECDICTAWSSFGLRGRQGR